MERNFCLWDGRVPESLALPDSIRERSVKKENIAGQVYERLTVLMSAWINEKGQQVWLCACSCNKSVRFLTTAQWKSRNRKSCGCHRVDTSRARAVTMNNARAGQPRSAKGKLASQAACKKMNEVRRQSARHVITNIDAENLTADCNVCGRVPIKLLKHVAGGLRDQYRCWVGSLRVHDEYADAKVRYPDHALEMYEAQQEMCAVCGTKMIRGNGLANEGMVLDHCHTTGYIRGFTHQRCNKGLAMFLDNPETFRRAADYLEACHLDKCGVIA